MSHDSHPPTASDPGAPADDALRTRSQPPDAPTGSLAPADATRDLHEPTAAPSARSASIAAPPAPPGYELLEEVGAGGMGIVYRAREIAFDRDVAVKILADRYTPDSAAAQRFLDEARITAQLQHPAIPPVHHIGTLPDGRPFLAMKLIKGETLADLLKTLPSLPGKVAGGLGFFLPMFAQVCQAVAYAHARKVIHRDLKPANIMVGAFGEVQVMDWGLAKVLGEGEPVDRPATTEVVVPVSVIQTGRDSSSFTQAGSLLGTPSYMPPEQAKGDIAGTDRRSDVFALGAMLCELFTGKPPYSASSSEEVKAMAVIAQLGPAHERLDTCGADPELVSLARRCLSADPALRPSDADEVAKAVSAHLAAAEERARQAELDRVRAEENRKRRRVQMALAGSVLLVLALAGVGVALVSFWRDAEAQRGIAESAQAKEAEANAALKREQDMLELVEYGRTMQVAYQEWRDNNGAAARALLDSTNPKFRGNWEWRHLDSIFDSSLLILKGHTDRVHSASFSMDGSWIVTASEDATAKVWDAETGEEQLTLTGHTKVVKPADPGIPMTGVISACSNVNGSRIVTASADKTAKVWEISGIGTPGAAAKVKHTLKHTGEVWSANFNFSADHTSRIVTGSADKTARVWDANNGKEVRKLEGFKSTVATTSFSVDGTRILTGSWDKTAKVWDAKTGEELLTLKGHGGALASARFSVDGLRIVTAGGKIAKVWDAKTGEELLTLKGHTGWVSSASFSVDGSRIVTASEDATAKVWDAKIAAEPLTLKGHTDNVWSARFSVDGSRIVTTGGEDQTAKVWDAKTGAELFTLKGHTDYVVYASFSADGSRILTVSWDNTAKVWDAKTGKFLHTLKEHSPGGSPASGSLLASFSVDGTRIATGSWANIAKVWNAETGAEELTLKGHTGRVYPASFSADGSRIVTGSDERQRRCGTLRTGRYSTHSRDTQAR